jgi:hypothetical protein
MKDQTMTTSIEPHDTPWDTGMRLQLDLLRTELSAHHAPPGVEKELLAAFAKQFPRLRWYHRLTGTEWGTLGGVGSTIALALVFVLSLHSQTGVVGEAAPPLIQSDNGRAFIALDSLESIQAAPGARVVEAELPRTALAAAGMAVAPESAGDMVRAEMLVAADGTPLAMRLSSIQ